MASGSRGTSNVIWAAGGSVGLAYASWSLLQSLLASRLGVDAIALLALVGALVVGEDLASAVIAVMLASGRALESWASGRARRDLQALLKRAPRTARRYNGQTLVIVPLDAVAPGDRLFVASGEIVPVDGVLTTTGAVLDQSALTGEPLPVAKELGDVVSSGVVNAGGPFDLRATSNAEDSTYAGIVRLVAEAEHAQPPFVRLADRYALWFLGVTLAASAGSWASAGLARAVAVLVVATPCPLILAAPIAFVSGLSREARRGVVVKGGAVLERLARCTTLLLDKTGTLTSGRPDLCAVVPANDMPVDEILRLAASLEQASPHVLSNAIAQAATRRGLILMMPTGVEEVVGHGIRGVVDGRQVAVGRADFVGITSAPRWAKHARHNAQLGGAVTVYVAIDDVPAGVLVLDDPIRPDTARTIRALRKVGIDRMVLVTGDRAEVANAVGAAIGIDDVFAERTPAEKVDVARSERRRAPTAMVGDGINDAPALALADVGVALGARGATASSEAADIVITVDRLDRVAEAIAIARRTRKIALQSVLAGMGLSIVAMGFAVAGYLPAVWGALLQEAIDVVVILNALRALSPDATVVQLRPEDARLTSRFRGEHAVMRATIDKLRSAADSLDLADSANALGRVRDVHRALVTQIEPHEMAEQKALYPAMDRLLGGADATGTMSRAHVEISHQIRRLGELLDDIENDRPDEIDVIEIRRVLYGLYAILQLHTAQEEESYLSLGDQLEPERDETFGKVSGELSGIEQT